MNIAAEGVDIEKLLPWGRPKEVVTRRGPRVVREARPDEDFWLAWRAGSQALKAAGVSVSEWPPNSGQFKAAWWRELPQDELARREQSVEDSSAVEADIAVPCPDGLEFRPYQLAGVKYMSERPGTYLADEPGLGKTPQTIGLINLVPNISRVLIFTKAKLKLNWYRELRRWLTKRDLTVGVADGDCFPSSDIVVLNYDIAAKWQPRFENFMWDLVVLDEAHYVKSRGSRRTRAIVGYQPKRGEDAEPSSGVPARWRVALSGTPIENKVQELYTVLHWLAPDKFDKQYKFIAQFCRGRMTQWGWKIEGPKNWEENQKALRQVCLLRRLKRDVLKDLPPKIRMVVELDPSGLEDQLRLGWDAYRRNEATLVEAQAELELAKTYDTWRDRVGALRRKVGVPFEEISRERHREALAKLPKVVEALRDDIEETGKKILVFFHHRDVGEKLAAEFPEGVLVYGGVDAREADRRVQRFMEDPECGPFFGSIRATGEGLNLTAASLVVFVEEDPVPSKMVQCEDRAHRFGQEDTVICKHYVVDGSLDANNAKFQVAKQNIADKMLDRERAADELEDPMLVAGHEPLATRREIEAEATIVTDAQKAAVREGLAALDTAALADRVDATVAERLLSLPSLGAAQAVLGRRLCFRHAERLAGLALAGMGGLPPSVSASGSEPARNNSKKSDILVDTRAEKTDIKCAGGQPEREARRKSGPKGKDK